MSIYREEAVDTLISCLKNVDFPSIQLRTAETILALLGRFSSSGRPLARTLLLKHAGIRKGYRALIETEQTGQAPEGSEHNLVAAIVLTNCYWLFFFLSFCFLNE